MSQYLDKLFYQTYKLVPQFSNSLQKISANKFYLNYPLELVKQNYKCTFQNPSSFLKSEKTIRPNNHIFFLQSNQFFASSSFAGATFVQQDSLTLKLQELKAKYEIFDDDMIARIKLTLSIQANSIDADMPLNSYAKYILKNRRSDNYDNYLKTHGNSGFLKSILSSNKLAVTTAHDYLSKSFLKQVKQQDFSSAYEMVRYFSKKTNKLRVIFPYCNNLKHSFDPNCQIRAMYLTHRRQTFLSLDSVRQISPGQQLTINYGNQNNYELFVRYGFAIQNNPYAEFYLPLDFSQIDQVFNANIEWKTEMFKKNKTIKLKNFIRLDTNGKINTQDMVMMKIVFSTKRLSKTQFESQSSVSRELQRQIYEFVRKSAQKFNFMLDKMINKRKQILKQQKPQQENAQQEATMHNVRIIEREEKLILDRLLKVN